MQNCSLKMIHCIKYWFYSLLQFNNTWSIKLFKLILYTLANSLITWIAKFDSHGNLATLVRTLWSRTFLRSNRIPWFNVHQGCSKEILIWIYFSRGDCKLHVGLGCCLRSYRLMRKIAGNPRKSIHIFGTVYLWNSWLVSFDLKMIWTSKQIHLQVRRIPLSFEKSRITPPYSDKFAMGPELGVWSRFRRKWSSKKD